MSTPSINNLIPLPASVRPTDATFTLTADAQVYVEPDNPAVAEIGRYLADRLKPATGFALPVISAVAPPPPGHIYLTTADSDSTLGEEGYELTITPESIRLVAPQPAGLFYGVQTIRQLLPPAIERPTPQIGPWTIPTVIIRDQPRYGWRGAMLDVARHFFGPADVRHYIDLLAYYKLNRLHLHLSDDQGWRIMIESWPRLATIGGSTQVGGGQGGYYSQAEYADLCAYAQSRFMTIIPEIDMPGHTNAALAAYAELNRDEEAPPLYTGTNVGFSSLAVDSAITYDFIDDVVREIAALTPGPYFHIGGDEASATASDDFIRFIERVQAIVLAHGKQVVCWQEAAGADLNPSAIVQYWTRNLNERIAEKGLKVIISPAHKAYLDMQYTPDTPLGLHWAAYIEVEDGYSWDPTQVIEGLVEENILGVEAPLWSETLETMADIEFMAFPRLPGYAEIGWSPATGRSWDTSYRQRLASHSLWLTAMGVNFYRSPQVAWP